MFNLLSADSAVWYPVKFDTTLDIARGTFFWLTIALVVAFVVAAIVLRGKLFGKPLKYVLLGAVCYACLVGVTLLSLAYSEEESISLLLFVPLLVLLLLVLASGIIMVFRRDKLVMILCGCAVGAALVAALVCMGVHFASGDSLVINWIESADDVSSVGLYVSAALVIVALIAAALLIGRNDKKGFDTKTIAYAAVCVSMSFALSYLRLVKMPQGGSITIASLLPLMVFSYMFGVRKGVFVGFIYGVLQAFQDPTILHPAQFLLDYPVAFACIGLAGCFRKVRALEKLPQLQFAFGGIVAGLARFLMHYLSGIFAFGSFAPAGQPAWLYSLVYQSAYVLPDIAIAIAVGIFVFSSRTFIAAVRKAGAVSATPDKAPQSPDTDNK